MISEGKISRGCTKIDYEDLAKPVHTSDGCCKLNVEDWLKELPNSVNTCKIVEVRFKNTRKEFYVNINSIPLKNGDVVAVEASPGHDLGIVSLVGDLVYLQMKKNNISINSEFKRIYRKAKLIDIEKWELAIESEIPTMLKARKLAEELNLNMKIGDVEFQGDKTKAIFYYIAEERVDFRSLIRILADTFRIRIEMRQIGARQEAGRIGGIGTCGRELCCATHIRTFVSVSTNSARNQELSLNPQKLAGQCGKLKCCLNFEIDCYIDAKKDFPSTTIELKTKNGTAFHVKTEIYKKVLWYSYDKENAFNAIPLSLERVKEIIKLNSTGIIPEELSEKSPVNLLSVIGYEDTVGQESLTRFDDKEKTKKKKKRNRSRKPKNQNGDNANKEKNQNNERVNKEISKKKDKVVNEKSQNTAKAHKNKKENKRRDKR